MTARVSVGKGFDESVEVVLGETYFQETGLSDFVDGVSEIVLYLYWTAFSLHPLNIKIQKHTSKLNCSPTQISSVFLTFICFTANFEISSQVNSYQIMKQLKRLHLILSALSALYPKTTNTLKLIGILCVLRKIANLLTALYSLIRPRKNLPRRYGAGTWALVTGSSEGIGKAIALQLARTGFNIVVSARTKSKLQLVKQQIQTKYPHIQVKILVVDYSLSGQSTFLQEKMLELEGLDISILVNNVGMDVLEYYHNLTEEDILRLIALNCTTMSILNRIFIPRFRRRAKRSAIVNVASLAGQIPMALHNIYSASKAFADYLSRALSYQYPRLDIISLRPSEVSTPMTFNKPPDIMTILPADCARGLLNDLGHTPVTNGHWSHCLQAALYHSVPECLFNYVFKNFLGPDFIKARQQARNKVNR